MPSIGKKANADDSGLWVRHGNCASLALAPIPAHSLRCIKQPRSSRWHNRKVNARMPAHRPPPPGRSARAEAGTPALPGTDPGSNAPAAQQRRRGRRGAAARLSLRASRLRVAPRANTIRTADQSSRAEAGNCAVAAPTRASTRKRTSARSGPVAPEMRLSATMTKARKVRRGEGRYRVMNPRSERDLHAPPRPPAPHPGSDPREHPTDPPVEVPVEPRPPHPGSDPVVVPTEPRPKHPSRRSSVGAAVQHARAVRYDR